VQSEHQTAVNKGIRFIRCCSFHKLYRKKIMGRRRHSEKNKFRILVLSKLSFSCTRKVIVKKNYIKSILEKAV
jgi:hypothetical protein